MSQPNEVKIQPSDDVDDKTNDHASHSSNTNQLKIIRMFRHSWRKNGRLKFVTTALCIFFAYFLVGICQEKIMRGCYGDAVNKDCRNGEKFKYAVTLVLVQSLCAFLFIRSKYRFSCHFQLECMFWLWREHFYTFFSFSVFSSGLDKARSEGRHPFCLLHCWIDGKCIGND